MRVTFRFFPTSTSYLNYIIFNFGSLNINACYTRYLMKSHQIYKQFVPIEKQYYISMCEAPCQSCATSNFYSCTSCTDATQILTGSLCLTTPTIYFQIVTTCLAFFMIIPVLMRKRCLTMVKIVDYIQLAAYFKLIKGYCSNRHIWLYLGMRSWGDWSEGWELISSDPTTPIWTVQEGIINKSIRIGATWGFFAVTAIVFGALKVALDEREMTFSKYMTKNIGNYFSYAFYFTLQDIAFVIAVPILNPNFSTTFNIISFCLAVFFAVFSTIVIIWSFNRINFDNVDQKYYHYKYLFLFSAEYDKFPTYDLLDLPKSANQIKKYSNIRIIDMIKKVAYAFLIVNYLSSSTYSASIAKDQLFQILALLTFFEIVWLVILPYNFKKQFLQFFIGIGGFGVTIYLLFGPWYISQSIVNTAIVLALFGLALVSLLIQFCFDIYKLVPVDLYETGLKVVIEDHRLLKQIAMRRREQEEIQRKLREIEEQNERLKKQMQQKQKNKQRPPSQQKIPTNNNIREDSQISLAAHNEVLKTKTELKEQQPSLQNDDAERQSMNSQDLAELYKVDQLKRRQVYQWNKQQPFVYSNKMQ